MHLRASSSDRRFDSCPQARRQGFARQSFAHGVTQGLDVFDFGTESGIGSNLLSDSYS